MELAAGIREMLLLLKEQLPDSIIWMSQFDDEQELFRIIDVLRDATWEGVDPGMEMPIDESFCYHVARSGAPELVDDLTKTDFNHLPIANGFGVHSYVGTPLTINGVAIGSVCAASREVAQYTQQDHDLVVRVGQFIARELARIQIDASTQEIHAELLRQARTDHLTGISNRAEFDPALDREWGRVRRLGADGPGGVAGSWVIIGDADGLKELNDNHGHQWGDKLLQTIGQELQRAARGSDLVARLGGDEFGVLLSDCVSPRPFLDRFREFFTERADEFPTTVGISFGVAPLRSATSASAAVHMADIDMYAQKRHHKTPVS